MISVEAHLTRVLSTVRRLPPTRMALDRAHGCVLATDVRSRVSLPGFDNSSMDGYAVHAADVASARPEAPVALPVDGDIAAGDQTAHVLRPGRTFRIMTGAPIPAGADAVVPVEQTDTGVTLVHIHEGVPRGQFVRPQGEDVGAGQVVLRAGTRLGPRQLALLAAVGIGAVEVIPTPRVVVVSTGDELVEPGTVPGFGQVVDSNSTMLAAAARDLGVVATRVGGIRDDVDGVLRTLRAQLTRADAIVTTGGVSMGAFDAVKAALATLGTVRFDRVAMQPGKPQGFGVLGAQETPVFTLPGNPVSALVSFEVFVAPALRLMAGRRPFESPVVRARAREGWDSPASKLQFARVVLTYEDDVAHVSLAGTGQGSHVLGGLAQADALALVPADAARVEAGDVLTCLPLQPEVAIPPERGSVGRRATPGVGVGRDWPAPTGEER